jgi:hypothetical protein
VDDGLAGGEERDVGSTADDAGVSDAEVVGVRQIVDRCLAEADVGRRFGCRRVLDRHPRLGVVGRGENADVVDRAKRREVVKRMVRRAERTVADARADADQCDRHVGVADVVLDLLE